MAAANPPRIMIVDDEEAILETMTFTFQDDYEIHTATDARKALEILDEKAPFAVVLTDQRMPDMSGVEFVTEVYQKHPATVRMILTGFSDMEAIIQAINDGHVYAYITKPWEPDHLKQVMKQAVDHYELTLENERLMVDLRRANSFLEAVMDELDTGALALDADRVIQAVNRPARAYLALAGDPIGKPLAEVLESHGIAEVGATAFKLADDGDGAFDEVELSQGDRIHRLRLSLRNLVDESGAPFGQVILFREISHEPLQRRFEALLTDLLTHDEDLRERLEKSREELGALVQEAQNSRIESPSMGVLAERMSRTRTALENWLEVDDGMSREDFPDAQLLQDRMRVALTRWPRPDEIPARVKALAQQVEDYYESGENPKQRVL
jgi:CheY-like chemotaxis protein